MTEKERELTQKWLQEFENSLANLNKASMHPMQYEVHKEALESQIASLKAELKVDTEHAS